MTPTQARRAVASKARSQVGYKNSSGWSYYGNWFSPNFAYALWCAMFVSWCMASALGTAKTIALIGRQYSWSVGHAWTVSLYDQTLARGGKIVSFDEAREGDLWLWRFGRSGAKVDHVDIGVGYTVGDYGDVVGGNTPQPGVAGDPRNGRGVWRHKRSRSYWNRYGVAIIRPNYDGQFKSAPDKPYAPRRIPLGMGVGKKSELSRVIQNVVDRPQTGTLNSGDIAAVKRLQRSLGVAVDGFFGPGTARAYIKSKFYGDNVMKQGDRGDAVELIQYIAGVPFKDLDGVWGPQTTAWVKKAQAWAKISQDGVWGNNSNNKLVRS